MTLIKTFSRGVATLAFLALPMVAGAQSRAFEVCFTSGAQSCSWFDVTTAAALDANTSARIGTTVDVTVRHLEGSASGSALLSALLGFSFHYSGVNATPAGGANVTDNAGLSLFQPTALGSAPAPTFDAWALQAVSSVLPSTSLYDNYFALTATGQSALFTQVIGGCGVATAGGVIDMVYTTELWTCGAGSGYRFSSFTSAWFDVANVNAIGVQTYGRFASDDIGVAPFCTAYLDAAQSIGDDGLTFGDVCAAHELLTIPPSTTVPEPATWAMVASGLAVLGLLSRGARRRGA